MKVAVLLRLSPKTWPMMVSFKIQFGSVKLQLQCLCAVHLLHASNLHSQVRF